MTKIYNPAGQSITFQKNDSRVIWREGEVVYKRDPKRLDSKWKSRMEKVLSVWNLPAFKDFIEGGYSTYFIEGSDLHGNLPFTKHSSSGEIFFKSSLRYEALLIFGKAVETGKRLGFTLGDITCGNMMTDGSNIFLLDYEVIVPWPLDSAYIRIWDNTLSKLVPKS